MKVLKKILQIPCCSVRFTRVPSQKAHGWSRYKAELVVDSCNVVLLTAVGNDPYWALFQLDDKLLARGAR